MKHKKLWMGMLIAAAVMMTTGGAASAEDATTTSAIEVSVGKQTTDGTSLDSMFPKVVYIHEGDTLTFKNGAIDTPHTVTFLAGSAPLNPQDAKSLAPTSPSGVKWDGKALLSSGILTPGASYSITFSASGAYSYYCVLHPMMQGTVVVLPKGATAPSMVEQAAAVKAQTDDLVEQADVLKAANQEVSYVVNADGTLTYQVMAGLGHMSFSTNRMFPETVVVSEGDSVEWMNHNHYEPHFITFNKPEDLQFFTPQGEMNPAFFPPSGGASFDGTGFTNSGIMMAGASYKLTFTKAGTYQYECYLHSGDKMVGTVIVVPKDSVKLVVNGKPQVYQEGFKLPQQHNNHVFGAIAPFVEAIGGTVTWDDMLNAVVIEVDGKHDVPATLQETGGLKVVINGKQLIYGFDPAPYLQDGRGYFALQEAVSLLGGSYSWDEVSKTFSVTVPTKEASPAKEAGHDMSSMQH